MLGDAWLLAVVLGAAPPSSLDDARRDETEVLRAERDALRTAVNDAKDAGAAATRSLDAEVESLATELERLQSDNAARERRLPVGERARASETQARQLVELVGQLGVWLGTRGVTAPDGDTPSALLPLRVEAVLAEIERTGGLRVDEDATWFDTDGAPQRADVLRIAEVAAITWDDRALPLLPTPEGLQQVAGIEPFKAATASATRVRAVLHDPQGRADPNAWVAATWETTMKRGGPLMWVLLGLGCVALFVAIERALAVAWIAARWRRALARIEALAHAEPTVRERGLAAETGWIAAPLVIVARQSEHEREDAHGRAEIEERATQAVIAARERLFRRLSLLGLCAGVAPLAGLLGTVNGMITTFSVVTTKGTSDAQLLAGGISEALLTTQFGLAIAIPALIGHALLTRGARRVLVAMEQAVLSHIHGVGVHEHHPPTEGGGRITGRLAQVRTDD
jgi:biopolymer transport protein ExbB/TolQ